MKAFTKIYKRVRETSLLATFQYLFLTVFLEKIGIEINSVFKFQDNTVLEKLGKFHSEVINSIIEINNQSLMSITKYGGASLIKDFELAFSKGEYCALGFWEGKIGCICWCKKIDDNTLGKKNAYWIWHCFTLPEHRGLGLYPVTLYDLCQFLLENMESDLIMVESSTYNISSIRGIEKAGFKIIRKELHLWKRKLEL